MIIREKSSEPSLTTTNERGLRNVKISQLLTDPKDSLFYLSCFFITFNSFPFDKYGLGSLKPLSFIFIVPYFLKLIYTKKVRVKKNLQKLFLLIAILLFFSFFLGLLRYNDLSGFRTSLGFWGGFIIYSSTISTFFADADDLKMYNSVRCVFLSFWFSFVFGILEFLLFEFDISKIGDFLLLFLRDDWYLFTERIQLNFRESGDAGQLLPGLFFPVVLYLKKKGYSFSFLEKVMIVGTVLLTALYSRSASFIIVGSLTLLLYFHTWLKQYKFYRITTLFLLIFTLVVGVYGTYELMNIASEFDGTLGRVALLMSSPEDAFEGDLSSAARIGMFWICAAIFFNNLFLGSGLGYMGYLFPLYLYSIPDYFITPEMVDKTSKIAGNYSYSIITIMTSEGGVVGLIWLLFFLYPLWKAFRKYPEFRPFIIVYFLIMLQQDIVNSFVLVYMWMLYTNTKFLISFSDDSQNNSLLLAKQ